MCNIVIILRKSVVECGHASFPLADCLTLHIKQPHHYHHHNRKNGSNATIIPLKVTTLFKNNKWTRRGRKEKGWGYQGYFR